MKNLFTITVFLLTALLTNAQNVYQEFRSTLEAYSVLKSFSFEVEVYVLENPTSKKPVFAGKGFAKKNNELFYSKFEENEMLQKHGKTILIDNEEKQIDCFEYNSKKAKDAMAMVDINAIFDSLATVPDTLFTYLGVVDGFKKFIKNNPDGVIQKIIYYIDVNTHLISRMEYYYGTDTEDYELPLTMATIYFKNVRYNSSPVSFFSEDRIFKKNGTQYTGVNQYKGYNVVFHKPNTKS